jgi:hypothetical protein
MTKRSALARLKRPAAPARRYTLSPDTQPQRLRVIELMLYLSSRGTSNWAWGNDPTAKAGWPITWRLKREVRVAESEMAAANGGAA